MSHFTVLVIGENPEEQLQPFHEYECTGIKDEHVVFVPDDEYSLDHEMGVKGHWTNPNAKWDWYSLGGRWTGFFKVKEGALETIGRPGIMTEPAKPGYSDQSLKEEIDFDSMRDEAGLEAQNTYELFMKAVGHTPANRAWSEVRESFGKDEINQARKYYHSQPRIQALRASKDDKVRCLEADDFLISKEDYIENARNASGVTFAVIKDGKWYERGEMGWWGVVSDEKDRNEWNKQFAELLDSIPDTTLLSVYDCHI